MEEKKKLWQQEDNFEGFGQAGVLSEEQKLDWNDMFTIMTLLPYTRKVDLFQKLPSKLSYVAELLETLPGANGTGTAGPCLAFGTTYWSKYLGGCLSLLLRRSVAPPRGLADLLHCRLQEDEPCPQGSSHGTFDGESENPPK
ncbi:hypothetical protein T459_05244 [Capsicum annuum]|uniref:Uncharacterized protein n=1 Tax=Capsicum annuum TaxID=4072 RepID=A0A2G3A7F0_CAPAN|nr:hypothetical protein T459_05244 [Capsicum annuum]